MENDIQREIYSKMTPFQKLNVANLLMHSARQLKYAQYKKEFPELSDNEIKDKVKKYFLHASS